jgi:H+/Cl- antiporter ClcA
VEDVARSQAAPPPDGAAAAQPADPPASQPADPVATMRSRNFVVLLVLAVVVGIVISFVAWAFLEAVAHIQTAVFHDLPDGLGFDSVPWWWPLPVLAVAGVVVGFAIDRFPGAGGHVPVEGFKAGQTDPVTLPGILLAAFGTLGLGVVLGPESPLVALGAGLTVWLVSLAKRDAPPQLLLVLAAAGSFAAISAVFDSPIIAAVLLIEATGLGGPTLPVILLPGLLGAGIGTLMFTGISSWGGLDTSAYSIGSLTLPAFARPTVAEVAWTVALGVAAAVFTVLVRRIGYLAKGLVERRVMVVVPAAGIVVALFAIAFAQLTDKGVDQVLFSGQDALPGLVAGASTWSMGALALLLLAKGLAWAVSLGSFRGGPTFPGLFLGAAGGLLASHLPGFAVSPGVAVGMGAMVAAVLKLPLSGVVLAALLTASAGAALQPLIIVGVVVAYVSTLRLERLVGAGVSVSDGAVSPDGAAVGSQVAAPGP